MRTHYTESISLTDLAERFHMNSSYLSDLFSKKIGMTFTQYRNKLRIDEAKHLLMISYNIDTVANMVGFEDSRYFSRMFQQYEHMTPSEFRRKNGNYRENH